MLFTRLYLTNTLRRKTSEQRLGTLNKEKFLFGYQETLDRKVLLHFLVFKRLMIWQAENEPVVA